MIDSDSCFLHETCQIYRKGKCIPSEFCLKLFKQNALFNEGLLTIPQRHRVELRIDSDGTDKQSFVRLKTIEKDIENFVLNGCNLYLYSPTCGNGKTSWSLRLLQSYIGKIWHKTDIRCRILFINVPKFFIKLKENISHENDYITHIRENVQDCDLVVWDDIGTKIGTDFEMENLLSIIDLRLSDNKANIYTSNISPELLSQRVGDRLCSRICKLSSIVELKGKDKRGT